MYPLKLEIYVESFFTGFLENIHSAAFQN